LKGHLIDSRCLALTLYVCQAAVLGIAQKPAPETKSSARFEEAIRLLQNGKYSEARQEFLETAQREPSSAECFYYLGMAEFGLHDLGAAEKDLQHALRLNPHSASVLYNLGVLSLEQKKAGEAVHYLERASDSGPDSPELSINLVRAYLESGHEDKGLEFARSARRHYGANTAFALTLGKVFLSHGLIPQARELLQQANQAAPHSLR